MADWHVYVVECGDGSYYTGIARDVERRLTEHREGRGARYTRGRGPIALRAQTGPMTRGDALRLELEVKRLPRRRKLAAIRSRAQSPAGQTSRSTS